MCAAIIVRNGPTSHGYQTLRPERQNLRNFGFILHTDSSRKSDKLIFEPLN